LEYLYIKKYEKVVKMDDTAVLEPEDAGETEEAEQLSGEEYHAGKIYCANCIQCKLVSARTGKDERAALRIRCAAGKWKKRLGEEKLYKYSTITRRYLDACDAYEEMGDTREFIRELRKNLTNKDDVYSLWEDEKKD
jgi:hypothetical protein